MKYTVRECLSIQAARVRSRSLVEAHRFGGDALEVLFVYRAATRHEEPFRYASTVEGMATGACQRRELLSWPHHPETDGTRIVVGTIIMTADRAIAHTPQLLLLEETLVRFCLREEHEQVVVLGLDLPRLKGLQLPERLQRDGEVAWNLGIERWHGMP